MSEIGNPLSGGSVEKALSNLDDTTEALDRGIEDLVDGSEDLAESHGILTSVSGIGPVSGCGADLPDERAWRDRQPPGRGLGRCPSPATAKPRKAGTTSRRTEKAEGRAVHGGDDGLRVRSRDSGVPRTARRKGQVHKVAVTAVMWKLIGTGACGRIARRMPPDARAGRVPRRFARHGTNQSAGRALAAGPFPLVQTAVRMWTSCGKPDSGSPKTVEKDRIRH